MSAQMGQTIVSIPAQTHLVPLCVAALMGLCWMPMDKTAQVRMLVHPLAVALYSHSHRFPVASVVG